MFSKEICHYLLNDTPEYQILYNSFLKSLHILKTLTNCAFPNLNWMPVRKKIKDKSLKISVVPTSDV